MKKKVIKISLIILLPIVIYMIGSGFIKKTDVCLEEYTLSEDNSHISMKVFVTSSIGYIGRYTEKQKDNDIYLTFYSTFGGLNSSLGAGNHIELDLSSECETIYFDQGGGTYRPVLKKNVSTNEWERVNNTKTE